MTHDAQGGDALRLELSGITKRYPSVVANDDVSLVVRRGEIHAVLGENGAGKSTLMKMIYGVTRPDAGEMKWEGDRLQVENPAHARSLQTRPTCHRSNRCSNCNHPSRGRISCAWSWKKSLVVVSLTVLKPAPRTRAHLSD